MTHRRFWMLPALALCLATAAMAQPQGYYPQQTGTQPPVTPSPYPTPPLPYQAATCTFSVEGGKVQIQTMGGAKALCESLTIPGAEAVQVTVKDKQVHLECGVEPQIGNTHDSLRGSADRVSRAGIEGSLLTLEGNAKLTVVRKGKRAELVSDQISVNLMNGHVEGNLGVGPIVPTAAVTQPSRPATRCVPPSTTTIPAPKQRVVEYGAPTVPLSERPW